MPTFTAAIAATPDHWLNVVLGVGAAITALGVAVGGWVALRYGRRASASLSATAYEWGDEIILAARPAVRAVGVSRVRFHQEQPPRVRVQEVYVGDRGDLELATRSWEGSKYWDSEYVDAGEQLTTSIVFRLPRGTERVVGWQVFLNISASPRRLAATGAWADQVFVPLPGSVSS